MSELKNCPFYGKEIYRCLNSRNEKAIRHSFIEGCPLSDTMWPDAPEVIEILNRRPEPKAVIPNKWIPGIGKCPTCKTELWNTFGG